MAKTAKRPAGKKYDVNMMTGRMTAELKAYAASVPEDQRDDFLNDAEKILTYAMREIRTPYGLQRPKNLRSEDPLRTYFSKLDAAIAARVNQSERRLHDAILASNQRYEAGIAALTDAVKKSSGDTERLYATINAMPKILTPEIEKLIDRRATLLWRQIGRLAKGIESPGEGRTYNKPREKAKPDSKEIIFPENPETGDEDQTVRHRLIRHSTGKLPHQTNNK